MSKQESEGGINPVAITIINPRKECWPSLRSNQRHPFDNLIMVRMVDLALDVLEKNVGKGENAGFYDPGVTRK